MAGQTINSRSSDIDDIKLIFTIHDLLLNVQEKIESATKKLNEDNLNWTMQTILNEDMLNNKL
jgi:hypothetical protein